MNPNATAVFKTPHTIYYWVTISIYLFWSFLTSCFVKKPNKIESYLIEFKRGGHLHIESSHSLRQNDAKCRAHPPSTLHVKMPNPPKIDVYNFRYKTNVGILMKTFFLSHKCINKVHRLVHKQIHYIASSAHIKPMPFLVPTLVNCK